MEKIPEENHATLLGLGRVAYSMIRRARKLGFRAHEVMSDVTLAHASLDWLEERVQDQQQPDGQWLVVEDADGKKSKVWLPYDRKEAE